MSDVDGSSQRRLPTPPGRAVPDRLPDALVIDPLHEPQRLPTWNALDDFSAEDPETSAGLGAPLRKVPARSEEAPVRRSQPANTDRPIVRPAGTEDLLELRRQAEVSLERAKHDAQTLARELNELRVTGGRLVQGFMSLEATCRLSEQRIESAAERLGAIESRLEPLATVRALTNDTDDRLTSLRQLAEAVMQHESRFEGHRQAIERGLVSLAPAAELLAIMEARIATLDARAEGLAQAQAAVEALERRAAGTTAALEARIVEMTGALDRRLTAFDTQKQVIERALADASRATERAAALNEQVADVTAPGHTLAVAESRAQQLQRHAAESIAILERHAAGVAAALEARLDQQLSELDRRVTRFDARQQAIEPALAEAASEVLTPTLAVIEPVEPAAATAPRQVEPAVPSASAAGRWGVTSAPRKPWARAWRARIIGAATPRPRIRILATGLAALTVVLVPGGRVMRAPDTSAPIRISTAAGRLPQARQDPPAPSAPDAGREAPPPTAPSPAGPITAAIRTLRPDGAIRLAPRRPPAPALNRDLSIAAASIQPEQTPSPAAPPVVAAKNRADAFVGVLAVESVPAGAAVFIDQQYVGDTPLDLTRIRAGSHAIRMEREGYTRWTASVVVASGKRTRLSTTLQPVGPFRSGGEPR